MSKRSAEALAAASPVAAAPEKRARTEPFKIMPSKLAKRVVNPIRAIVDSIKPKPSDKEMIPLTLGDPTVFGNLLCPAILIDKVVQNAKSRNFNGYAHSAGRPEARAALAKKYSNQHYTLSPNDIIVASGGSGALEIVISGIADKGHNILLPRPGFCLYATIAKAREIDVRYYNLVPERGWSVDLTHLESQIDANTRAILINNPSNPCGSVFSKEHLLDLLQIAEKHRIPIISDEIYASMTFRQHPMHSVGDLSERVPVVVVSGLAKEFIVPGWRVGWAVLHDRGGAFEHFRKGLLSLSQLVLGANTLIQSVMPVLLDPQPGSEEALALTNYRDHYVDTLERHAALTLEILGRVPQLGVQTPQGAMYAMVQIKVELFKDIPNDQEFCRLLLDEESVFVLPGKCFGLDNYFRLVFAAPSSKLREAYSRVESFCARHAIAC